MRLSCTAADRSHNKHTLYRGTRHDVTTHLLPELVICKDTEIARARSYVWLCAVLFVEVIRCEQFGDVWKIEGSTCLLNEGRMCCRCDICGAPVGERQAGSGCNSNDAASGSGWLLLRQVSVDGEAEAVEVVEHVLDRIVEVVARPKVASVVDDAREQHTLATVHVLPDVSASECVRVPAPWPSHLTGSFLSGRA